MADQAFKNRTKKVYENTPFEIQTVRISDADCTMQQALG
jgi:hypothetical protein